MVHSSLFLYISSYNKHLNSFLAQKLYNFLELLKKKWMNKLFVCARQERFYPIPNNSTSKTRVEKPGIPAQAFDP